MGDQSSLAEDAEDTTTCPTCSTEVPLAWEHCPKCGGKIYEVSESAVVDSSGEESGSGLAPCVRCGEKSSIDLGQCTQCGAPIEPTPGRFLSRTYWLAFFTTTLWSFTLLTGWSLNLFQSSGWLLPAWSLLVLTAYFVYQDIRETHEIFTPDVPAKVLAFVIVVVPFLNALFAYWYLYKRHSLSTPPTDRWPSYSALLMISTGSIVASTMLVPPLFGLAALVTGYLIRTRHRRTQGTVLIVAALTSTVVGMVIGGLVAVFG